jgi:L-alanine-DL-glutamate epimerase-like enolase superfamily enzyme
MVKIKETSTRMISIKLDQPFALGFGELYTLPRVIYTIKLDNGVVGYGESSIDFPFSNYDMFDVYYSLKNLDIIGRDINDRSSLLYEQSLPNGLMKFPSAFTAFSMALDDAIGKTIKVSILDMYKRQRAGGFAMKSIPFNSNPTITITAARWASEEGYLPKIKVGMGEEKDIELISLMEKAQIKYALDFNATYTLAEAREIFNVLIEERGGIKNAVYVEQPTKVSEGISALGEIRKLLRRNGIPSIVIADESFVTKDDAIECVNQGLAINMKMQKIGGLYQARLIEEEILGRGKQLKSTVGGTFPTAIGRVYDQAAACILVSASLHSDGLLPSTDYFKGNNHLIVEQFRKVKNLIVPIEGNGLGITVDEGKIKPLVIENPAKEYEKIRSDKTGEKIIIKLRDGASYSELYKMKSGKDPMWNIWKEKCY